MTCRWTLWRRQPWQRRMTWPRLQLRQTQSPHLCASGWVATSYKSVSVSARPSQLLCMLGRPSYSLSRYGGLDIAQAQLLLPDMLHNMCEQRCAGASGGRAGVRLRLVFAHGCLGPAHLLLRDHQPGAALFHPPYGPDPNPTLTLTHECCATGGQWGACICSPPVLRRTLSIVCALCCVDSTHCPSVGRVRRRLQSRALLFLSTGAMVLS